MTKLKKLILFLLLPYLSCCSLMEPSFNLFFETLHYSYFDTCDLFLIYDITEYRKLNDRYPEITDFNELTAFSDECKKTYDSIHLKPFKHDSIELFVNKFVVDSTQKKDVEINKTFIISYENDSSINFRISNGYVTIHGQEYLKSQFNIS